MVLGTSTTLDDLVEEAKHLSTESLDARFSTPVLLVVPSPDNLITERLDVTNPSMPKLEARPAGTPAPEPAVMTTHVFQVRSRAENVRRGRLSVGRDETRDVPIPLGTVSSLHAYLEEVPPDGWQIVDANSTNGTWVDGRRVDPKQPMPLRDGCEIKLGENITTFWLASSFRAALRRRARTK